MLKNPLIRASTISGHLGTVSVLSILIVGVLAAGLRPPVATAQTGKEKSAPAAVEQPDEQELARIRFDNLKNIGLAMHNYLDKHGSFPGATIEGPGGIKHSWRVEILPQLGYTDLFSKYRLDEPWDSPANKKLLEMIPEIYQAHGAPKNSPNTSYFAIVGKGTAFELDGRGLKIEDFTDGTVNTLLVVESKRDVPWTKPDEISFEMDKPLPKLGGIHDGGFACVFTDGAAHFIVDQVNEDVLRDVIRRNDGNIVDYDKLHP